MTDPDRPRPVPTPPSPARRARLNALADLHSAWVQGNVADAPFDAARARAKTPSDYNVNYLDVDGEATVEDAFTREARFVMGLDPDTGTPAA